jgi:hypothetical protein
MTPPRSAPRPPPLLVAHPELYAVMERSDTFRHIQERARIVLDGRVHYLVHGDTLGSLDDLFVDALSRGSSAAGSDPPSRSLFLELPPTLQDAVRRSVRPDPET